MIRLFEVEDGVVKPTEHCYMIPWLKDIMEKWPEADDHLKIYAYAFYLTCPSKENPYYNVSFEVREDTIIADLNFTFDVEDDAILKMVEELQNKYETPTVRAHRGITTMLDNMAKYMEETEITAGRDGNITALIRMAKDFDAIRQSYKGVAKDLDDEQQTSHVRGNQNLAYDQL